MGTHALTVVSFLSINPERLWDTTEPTSAKPQLTCGNNDPEMQNECSRQKARLNQTAEGQPCEETQ